MSEIRQNMVTGEWVFFASERGNRPHDFIKKVNEIKKNTHCSFCPGNENETTKTIYKSYNGQSWNIRPFESWNIRVFENMYPAVGAKSADFKKHDFYKNIDGIGFHEVVVDTSKHFMEIEDFTQEHMFNVLKVLKNRFEVISSCENIEYVQIFKNKGPEAGASLQHSHWQIMGIPVISLKQKIMAERCKTYYNQTERCLICDIIKNEIKEKIRIIDESENFICFAPYASKITYEMCIAPKSHISSYGLFPENNLKELSDILKKSLLRIRGLDNGICYNICFQDKPLKDETHQAFHWHIRIIPRTGNFAGFEFATGSFINHVFPEKAAEDYRKIDI